MVRRFFFAIWLAFYFPCILEAKQGLDPSARAEVLQVRKELSEMRATPSSSQDVELLNVSFDPTREFYDEINTMFAKWWKEKTGQQIEIDQSHGGSGKQARSVIFGLQADVVSLALSFDIDAIQKETHWLNENWAGRLPNRSVPFTSTIVFLVKRGNPKGIKDWEDLVRPGVSVITPNPKTSGGARWNYMAAWAYADSAYKGNEEQSMHFMRKLFQNVPILETGARGATTTFAKRNMGDVLLTWESEAFLACKEFGTDKFEIIYPSLSINAELPVAWIDHVVQKKHTEQAAKTYLKFLYTKEAQKIAATHFYRPIDPDVFAEFTDTFQSIPTVDVSRFGSWEQIHQKHFANGGIFDQIYEFARRYD